MNTDHSEIISKIKSFVQQSTYADLEKIQNNTLLFKEGYFDSMGFISLIAFIEEEFDIKTIDADLIEENFESIDAIAGFIARKSK
jgi:acyl carrier protein